MAVIGLDVGTSGVKSTVLDENAQTLSYAYREYNLIGEAEKRYEVDPRALWECTQEVLAESAKAAGCRIDAITVTSFGETFVCLDEQDRVLCNSMIYMDPRGAEECEEFRQKFSGRDSFSRTGQLVDPMYALYKYRWMRKHMPEVMARTKRICFVADFMTYMLGGAHRCDYSLAARSGMFDVFEKRWVEEYVEFATIEPSALPEPVPGGSVVGELSPQMAERLGIDAGAKLVIAGHDQITAALGSGAWDPGDIANGIGTVDCLTTVVTRDEMDMDALYRCGFAISPYLDSGNYVTFAFNMSGGCGVKWFRDSFARDLAGRRDAYALLNAEAPDEPTDLLVLPYFAGAGTPSMDSTTPAVIAGLRLGVSRGKVFRALLEGESYEMMVNVECMRAVGIEVKKVLTVGGGANSPLWMQIRADVFNLPVNLPAFKEAGTFASAMMSFVSTGRYSCVHEAQRAMVRYAESYVPDAARHAIYERQFARYKRYCAMLRDFYGSDAM